MSEHGGIGARYGIAVVGAVGVICTLFLPWYRAPNQTAYCRKLLEASGASDPQVNCTEIGDLSVGLWPFQGRAFVVVLAAVLAILAAETLRQAPSAGESLRPVLLGVAGAVALVLVVVTRQVRPEDEPSWHSRGGSLIALVLALLSAVGLVSLVRDAFRPRK